jgi:hypothetical protein
MSLVNHVTKFIQVVEQSSAIIEGRLSDGLTVNHSALNKYTSDQDPNLIKIGKVVAEMVHSSILKIGNATSVPQGMRMHICLGIYSKGLHSGYVSTKTTLGVRRILGLRH